MFSPDLFRGKPHDFFPGITANGRWAKYHSRREVYVRYYLIDFGLSQAFSDARSRRPSCTGYGRYKNAPELSKTVPYDGFALDVWCVGMLVKEQFLEVRGLPVIYSTANMSSRNTPARRHS